MSRETPVRKSTDQMGTWNGAMEKAAREKRKVTSSLDFVQVTWLSNINCQCMEFHNLPHHRTFILDALESRELRERSAATNDKWR